LAVAPRTLLVAPLVTRDYNGLGTHRAYPALGRPHRAAQARV